MHFWKGCTKLIADVIERPNLLPGLYLPLLLVLVLRRPEFGTDHHLAGGGIAEIA